jgi:hypothetical protein
MAMHDSVSSSNVGGHRRAIGVFSDRRDAEHALHELRDSGFPMEKVSIITRDPDHKDNIAGAEVGDRIDNKADEGAKVGAISGGTLGGITGLLVGLGTLAIPGVGPIMLAGAAATTLATTLAGGAIGAAAGGLLGALVGMGIPEERARVYNDRVARGDYLIIVDGTDAEIARAETLLQRRGIEEYGVYSTPHSSTVAASPMNPTATTPMTPASGDYSATSGYPTAGGYSTTSGYPTAGGYPTAADEMPQVMPQTGIVGDRSMRSTRRAIGTFSSHREAEAALIALRDSGFLMDRVSVIAKNADPNDSIAGVATETRGGNRADEGAKAGAATGGILGGLGGLLVGLGTLAIPGVGPVIAGGAAATALATTLSGGAIGAAAGGLTGALVGLGIPESQAQIYNDRFSRGDYLVMVDGTEEELHRAESVLRRHNIHDWNMFDRTDVDAGSGRRV